jgi:MFS superfamily sulfate permease-like transporter
VNPPAAEAWPAATIAFLAWLVRAGSVVNFVSETVLIGFKAGVALQLASTQLPKLFGVKGGHGNFWERMDLFFRHIGETNATALTLGCAALGVLILGKKLLPNKPVALFVVIGGMVFRSAVACHNRCAARCALGRVAQRRTHRRNHFTRAADRAGA